MKDIHKSLVFRIVFPVVAILIITFGILYGIVLKNVSDFAQGTIKASMDEIRHDIYEICDDGLNRLIKAGYGEDQRRVRITKAEIIERIERFLLSNNLKAILEENGKVLLPAEGMDKGRLKELKDIDDMVLKEIDNHPYYIVSLRFEPWGWRFYLFKEQREFSELLKKVRLSYGITGLVITGAIVFLSCLLHLYIHRPVREIVTSLRSGNLPDYKGTEELEYLSTMIRETMESLRKETRLLDNIYHVAITRRGEEFFDEVVFTINRLFGLNSLIARLSPDGEYADAVSLFINGELKKGVRIPLKGTPCEDVLRKKHMCVMERESHREFPDAFLLTSTKAESFIGIAIFNRKGEPAGIMNAFGKERTFSEVDIKAFQTIGQIVAIEFERIEEEKEKEKIREQLFQAQKLEAIGTLAGGIAHDFNNMLQAILGYASLLKMQTSPEHPSYHALDIIEKTSLKAADLTKQLLGFARKGKYVVEPLNINDLVNDVYKIISRTFDRSIEIKLNLDSRGLLIEGDKSQLTSVILNICLNARDAMPEGGLLTIETFEKKIEAPEIIHPDARPIRYAAVSITDTGIGMDEETMKHIFEPFFTTKEVGKGTGMGLAMAYGVVQNHGGFITVESRPKEGSRFIIYLPLLEGKLKEGVKKEMGEFIRIEKGKGRILIVEDENSIRKFTKETLEELGYEVLEARDGIEAIAVYKGQKDNIDLVILDLILPGLNGLDVFKKIKEFNPEQKVIISTGYGLKSHLEELLGRKEVAAFLEKPYTYITLTTALKKALYGYELDDD